MAGSYLFYIGPVYYHTRDPDRIHGIDERHMTLDRDNSGRIDSGGHCRSSSFNDL